MTSLLSFKLVDSEEKEATFSVNVSDGATLSDVDTLVSALYSSVVPITNARFVSAKYTYSPPFSPVIRIDPTINIYNRLIVLCTIGEKRASITIPSPSSLPTVLLPTYSGFKLEKASPLVVASLAPLIQVLADTVLFDGSPFPAILSEAAYMVTT